MLSPPYFCGDKVQTQGAWFGEFLPGFMGFGEMGKVVLAAGVGASGIAPGIAGDGAAAGTGRDPATVAGVLAGDVVLWYDSPMNKANGIKSSLFLWLGAIFLSVFPCLFSAAEYPAILALEKQAETVDRWLKIRLDTVLPEVMRREKIDMWIVICREYNEDPVFLTLVPSQTFAARRTSILVFFDRGKDGVECLTISQRGLDDLYTAACTPDKPDPWQCLAQVVAQRNPRRIGINESDTFNFGDGLSASLKRKLVTAIGPKYAPRLQCAEKLAIGWLERRTPGELEVYPQIVAIAHAIIAEAFSNRVITPGVTTTTNVMWWMRKKIQELGVAAWFHPWVDFQRPGGKTGMFDGSGTIKRGDLLHCDIGITYLRLNTDTQEMAYVLKEGETDAPDGLKNALRQGNLLQDIFTAEFKVQRTGNQILLSALSKAREAGLNGQIYTHPLGFHGHAAGPTFGLWDQQWAIPGQGDYLLYEDTCYAIELNVRTAIPEWNGQEVRIGLEQDAVFSSRGVRYIDGRQTLFHIIK